LPIKRKSPSFEALDALEEVKLGSGDEPRTTKTSGLLAEKDKNWLIELITKYKTIFLVIITRC